MFVHHLDLLTIITCRQIFEASKDLILVTVQAQSYDLESDQYGSFQKRSNSHVRFNSRQDFYEIMTMTTTKMYVQNNQKPTVPPWNRHRRVQERLIAVCENALTCQAQSRADKYLKPLIQLFCRSALPRKNVWMRKFAVAKATAMMKAASCRTPAKFVTGKSTSQVSNCCCFYCW